MNINKTLTKYSRNNNHNLNSYLYKITNDFHFYQVNEYWCLKKIRCKMK